MSSGFGRGGFQGLIIALFFFGPLLAAFLLYGPAGYRPDGSVAHGTLLEPGQPVPVGEISESQAAVLNFRDRWALVYYRPTGCDVDCQTRLAGLTAVWQRLAKERVRVQRILIVHGSGLDGPNDAGFYRLGVDAGGPLSAFFSDRGGLGEPLFITDPLGNAVLRYGTELEPAGLLEDLERLLRLSRIG